MASTSTSGSPGGSQGSAFYPFTLTHPEALQELPDPDRSDGRASDLSPRARRQLPADQSRRTCNSTSRISRLTPAATRKRSGMSTPGRSRASRADPSRHSRSRAPGAFRCLSVSERCTLTHSYSWRKDVAQATTIEATAKEYYASIARDHAKSTENEELMHQQLTESQVKLARLTNEKEQAWLLEANKLAMKGFGLAALQKAGNFTDAEVEMIASVWVASGDWYVPAGGGGWRLSFKTLVTDNPQSTRFLQRFKVPLRRRIEKAIKILDKPDVPSMPFVEAMEKMVNDLELLQLRDDRNEKAHEGPDDDEEVKEIMRRYFAADMSEKEQTVGRMLAFAKVTKPAVKQELNAITFIKRNAQ